MITSVNFEQLTSKINKSVLPLKTKIVEKFTKSFSKDSSETKEQDSNYVAVNLDFSLPPSTLEQQEKKVELNKNTLNKDSKPKSFSSLRGIEMKLSVPKNNGQKAILLIPGFSVTVTSQAKKQEKSTFFPKINFS